MPTMRAASRPSRIMSTNAGTIGLRLLRRRRNDQTGGLAGIGQAVLSIPPDDCSRRNGRQTPAFTRSPRGARLRGDPPRPSCADARNTRAAQSRNPLRGSRMAPEVGAMRIAIIGAGNVGGALGRAFSEVGHDVVFGVRDPDS